MTGVNDLRAAGFSDEEVNGWADRQRQTLSAAGFSGDEIKNYLHPELASISAKAGPMEDVYYGQSPIGRILHAFGQGAAQGWGSDPSQLSPDTEDFLKKSGVFNDYENGRTSLIKSFNEAMIRPAATALNTVMQAGGALLGGAQAAVSQAGAEAGAPGLGRELAAVPEAFFGMPGGVGVHLPEARSLNVIGPGGEAAWKGLPEVPTRAAPARAQRAFAEFDAQAAAIKQATEGQPEAPLGPAQPDIHAIARQIAPDTFNEYDALSGRRDAISRHLNDLRGGSEIAELDDRIDEMRGRRLEAPQAERAAMANEITGMEEERQRLSEQLGTGIDTAEMRVLRQQLQEADHRMRDLAPDVAAAYRQAQAGTTPEVAPEAVPKPAQPQEAPPAPEVAPPAEAPQSPRAAGVGSIFADVSRKLTDAGRPAEEADAAAEIVEAHYAARAARFEGAKGTPEELYAAEAPDIISATGGRTGAAGKTVLGAARNIIALFGRADASTFMHETGHSWLNELLNDSVDPKAPAELIDDAKTVRDWLGATTGPASPEDITTRQHEKFARGFERYLMEGTAPSKGLASVFAKFQEWLTAIYQTVGRLRSPITDDIRNVFDRMLVQHPEKVIAPERVAPESFVDAHEAAATATAPEQASATADRIRGERDEIARQHTTPGFDAERQRERGGEAGGGAAGSGIPDGGGNARQLEPAGADAGGQPGAVGAGGGQAAPQGTRVSAEPTEPFARVDSELVDKAGNIRLDNINTEESFKQAIRDAAERNDEFIERRRGVVSDADRLRLADILGTTPDKVFNKQIGQSFSDSEIKMIERSLAQSSANVHELSLNVASDEDLLKFTEAYARHDMIQGIYSQATAESGRALRALRKSQEFWSSEALATSELLRQTVNDATGRTLYQMRQIAGRVAKLQTSGQISKFVRDTQRPGVFDWLQSVFVNALLSGPFTHLGYTAAGEMFALFRAVGETAASAAVGKIREIGGFGEAEYAHIVEMPYQLYGIMRGGRNGTKAAWQAYKANEVALPAEVQRQTKLPPEVGKAFQGFAVIPNPQVAGITLPIGKILESPGRMIAALHSFNWTTFYTQSISGQAFRQAMREKLQGSAFANRVADLTTNPTDAMIQDASVDASAGALMSKPAYDSLMGNVSRLTNWGMKVPDIPLPGGASVPMGTLRPLKYIDPFVQITANVQRAAFLRGTPLAAFSQAVRDDLSMKNGGVAFDRTAGKILAGSTFMIAAGGLAAEGLLNPSGPSDPREAAGWQRVFGLPHGLRIGNFFYNVLRLGNLGMQMSVSADLYHAVHQIGKEDNLKIAGDLVHAFVQNIKDESFMRGPSEIMRAVDEYDRYGAQWARNFISSAIPFSVGLSQIAREIDPYSRQARTTMDAIKAKIPFESEALFPRRDIWGEPVPNREWFITYSQHASNDPVDRALYDLEIFPSQPERRINGVELSDRQYDDYSKTAGRMAKMALDKIVVSRAFQMAPQVMRHDMMKEAIDSYRGAARAWMLMQPENRNLITTPVEAIKAKIHGAKPSEVKTMLRQQ